MERHIEIYPQDKGELYALLAAQTAALTEGERHFLPNLANFSALLFSALRDINWAGFYLMHGSELLLGPFQGRTACIHIPLGKGVCGVAAQTRKTQLVPDVHLFPGHIACDAASRSEIVVPLVKEGVLCGVLDIDSPLPSRFDDEDRAGLERLAALLLAATDMPENV